MYTRFKNVNRFAGIEFDFLCGKHGTIIHAFIRDEVNHDASMADLILFECFVGAFDGMRAGEHARQGRMQVDDPVRKMIEEGGCENAHPAREDDVVR